MSEDEEVKAAVVAVSLMWEEWCGSRQSGYYVGYTGHIWECGHQSALCGLPNYPADIGPTVCPQCAWEWVKRTRV